MRKSLEKEDILEELGFKGHGTHQCGHKDRDRPWEGLGRDKILVDRTNREVER